jgi:hypothetical protein
VTVQYIKGDVQSRPEETSEFSPAVVGQTLAVGAELTTGPNSSAALVLDDGLVIRVAAASAFKVSALEGSHESPITRFFLNLGAVFSISKGELPAGASYEIETPDGVATIRGSMLGVRYDPKKKLTRITCLTGHCSARAGDKIVDLVDDQQSGISGGKVDEPGRMTGDQKHEWSETFNDLKDAGLSTNDAIDPACACDGINLTCPDGTVIPEYPTCTAGAACQCQGTDLVCDDGKTYANSAACKSAGATCSCDGPNLYCDDGSIEYQSQVCLGDTTCSCQGVDLVCGSTTYADNPACQDFQSLGCTCSGTSLVCPIDGGGTISMPDNPMCAGGGGSQCYCLGTDLYCADGSVTAGASACAGGINPADYLPPPP